MTRALVTGGAGFIGSHLVHGLLARGAEVRVVDNLTSGSLDNLQDILPDLEFREGDIRDEGFMQAAARGVEVVYHQAAIASVPLSMERPDLVHAVNTGGTLTVLEASRHAGVRRLVYAASSAVYGNAPQLPKREDMPPDPQSPYAAAKHAGELYTQVHYRAFGLETVCLRYFNVFGPGQSPRSQYAAVIPAFLAAALSGRTPVVYGDGGQTRDFVFVEDVVRANLSAAEADRAACGLSFNVAGGRPVSLNDLLSELGALLGRDILAEYGPERPGDIRHSYASIERAQRMLGWEPQVPLRDGLARSLDWYRGLAAGEVSA